MSFSHRQGGASFSISSGGTVVLGSTPLVRSLLVVELIMTTPFSAVVVKDSNNNAFTPTPATPISTAFGGSILFFYLLSAPANITKTIGLTFTGSFTANMYVEEFTVVGGTASFDKETSGTGTAINVTTPSITPAAALNVLYAMCWDGSSHVTDPTAGATLSGWTGAAGGLGSVGEDCEYRIDAIGLTNIAFTQIANDPYAAAVMVFTFTPSGGGAVPLQGSGQANDVEYHWIGGDDF